REDMDTTQMETIGNYVGMDFEKAKAELSSKFLYAVQIDAVYNKEIPAGVIISQDIREGSQLPQGGVINMVVSKGVETAQVPDVTGMTTDQARAVLAEAKLLCIVTYVSNPDHELDYVLTQSAKPGDKVPLNTEIWIEASVGSGSYTASTGGWSGAPLPEVHPTQAPTEAPTQPPATEAPKPAETDPPAPQYYAPAAEEELPPPPMPVD
ncbi:MAG: PASTA domain-containing protein, partial [Oscillospiraceae bacterium]|nr:PASTA domain-containing protein [Oscillospiraceae bacterium]